MSRLSKRPTVYRFRYVREDGHYREISVPVGAGRFRTGSLKQAQEIAERRLSEQYGDALLERERRERDQHGDGRVLAEAQLVRDNPELHQSNYTLASVTKA